MGETECLERILVGKLKVRDNLEDLGEMKL
jgi:hypothetical protein